MIMVIDDEMRIEGGRGRQDVQVVLTKFRVNLQHSKEKTWWWCGR